MTDERPTDPGYVLGVDLGTTFTAAAVCRPGRRPEMVTLGSSGYGVPTVLALRDDGTFLFGEHAEMRAPSDPTRVARFFKRQLGDGSSRIIGGTPFSPQTLTAQLLRWVLGVVTERMGEPPAHVVLTHPANWGPYRREIFEQAAVMAGVESLQLCSEPEAAAINYAAAERIEQGELVGVYDLGGGTFDAVIMRRQGDGFEVVGQPRGVERLGGIDFDDAIAAFVAEACDLDLAELAAGDEELVAAGYRLRNDCTAAKRLLSADTSADIRVSLPGVSRTVRLTRSEFEQRIWPRLTETTTAFESALGSAQIGPEDLGRILLVGGSSRIPLVAQILTSSFGRPIAVDADPKNAVASGAALLGTLDVPSDPLPSEQHEPEIDVRDLTDLAPGAPPTPLRTVDLRTGEPPSPAPVAPTRLVADAPAPPRPPTRPVATPTGKATTAPPTAPAPPTPEEPPPSELAAVMSESRHRASFGVAAQAPVAPPTPTTSTSVAPAASGRGPVLVVVAIAVVLVLAVLASQLL